MERRSADVLQIQVHSGIPILVLCGEWCEALQRSMVNTVQSLGSSAHFDLILNFQQAVALPLADPSWWKTVDDVIESCGKHYGRVDMVVTPEQGTAITRTRPGLKWNRSLSVMEAVCHIKGVFQGVGGDVVKGMLALTNCKDGNGKDVFKGLS